MTDLPIDPAATPEDDDAPEIAAGASGLAERIGRQAESPVLPDSVADEDEEGVDGEGV